MPEYPIPEPGDIPSDFLDAAGKITSGELVGIINDLANKIRTVHTPTTTAASSSSAPGQGATPIAFGAVVGLNFDTVAKSAYRVFKIQREFSGDGSGDHASFHIHWTKSADGDESGNPVRWKISYTVFAGDDADISVAPTVILLDDVYDDASIDGTRIVYRTAHIPAPGFISDYYVGLKVEYDAGGTSLSTSNPVLISADIEMNEYINRLKPGDLPHA